MAEAKADCNSEMSMLAGRPSLRRGSGRGLALACVGRTVAGLSPDRERP
jgi:hypothetical protein